MLHGFGRVDAHGMRGGGCGWSAEERQAQHRQEGGGAGQRSRARAVFSLVEPALRLDYHKIYKVAAKPPSFLRLPFYVPSGE
jgi:hypothetical protein